MVSLFISVLSTCVAFAAGYFITYKITITILAKFIKHSWSIKSIAFIAASFSSLGAFKIVSYLLMCLLIQDYRWLHLANEKELFISSFIIGAIFPIILLIISASALFILVNVFNILSNDINEDVYLEFTKEAQSVNRREGLWAKCLITNNGDEKKALSAYVKARIKESKRTNKPNTISTNSVPSPLNFKSVALFFYVIAGLLMITFAIGKFL